MLPFCFVRSVTRWWSSAMKDLAKNVRCNSDLDLNYSALSSFTYFSPECALKSQKTSALHIDNSRIEEVHLILMHNNQTHTHTHTHTQRERERERDEREQRKTSHPKEQHKIRYFHCSWQVRKQVNLWSRKDFKHSSTSSPATEIRAKRQTGNTGNPTRTRLGPLSDLLSNRTS